MKKIFNFGKKEQPSSSSVNLPSYFRVQSTFRRGYRAQSKDLREIHKATLRGKVEKVQQLLLLGKSTVNELDKKNRTPLHLASANGHPNIVSLLIEKKCELNLLDNENKTPLMKAIECGREECATILLEHGADPNLRDGNNNTILHYIASGETKFMAEKLFKHKIDIEAKNKEGLTPLMLAIKARNNDVAVILLKNGANVNAMDDSKRTALMIAVSVEDLDLVTLLFENNADHTLQDKDGWTAEKYAKVYGYPLHLYRKQIENQMLRTEKSKEQFEKQEPCTSQIRTSAPSLNKKEQENIVEDSISRCSDSSGSVKSWKSTDDELDFDTKELPKLNLVKLMSARISGETSSSFSTAVLEDNQSNNEKEDLTDSFSKSSSQAHCSSHAVVHSTPSYFSQSSLKKSTLLDILKEYPGDSEEEAKENDVLVKNDTGIQISPNIPGQLQAHSTSEKHAERKATKSTSKRSKEEEKSSWASECSVENLLEGSARHLASTNQNINKSISLGREDHTGKNRNVKTSQCSLPMKDSSTSQESEKGVKAKPKLAFMEKVDVSAAEDTDDHPGKNLIIIDDKTFVLFLDHTGKNRNVKTSQCGLAMKDSSTSQESEKVVKFKEKLEVMGKFDLTTAENNDDSSNWDSTSTSEIHKTHRMSEMFNLKGSDVGKSLLKKLNKLGSRRVSAGSGSEVENPGPQKQCERLLEKEPQKHHPGKNPNMKTSQCGLPMKDSSTSQESEKGVKAKPKLDVVEKFDLTAAENTGDSSNWDSTSTSEIHKTHRSSKMFNLKGSDVGKSLLKKLNKLGSRRVSAGSGSEVENPGPQKQCERLLEKEPQKHHPGKNPNMKTSQCGLPMKDSSTSQESEKGVKAKPKLDVVEKFDLTAAENTGDSSNWDSTSTSEIHKTHRSSKMFNLKGSDVGKSLLKKLNKLGSRRVSAGSGSEVENPGPQKQCERLLEKEPQKHHPGKNPNMKTSQCGLPMKDSSTSQESEKGVKAKPKLDVVEKFDLTAAENTGDLIQKPEFKGSSDRNQESFDKRNQAQYFHGSLLAKFERRLKESSCLGQHEGHLSSNSNEKHIQSTLQISQEVVKRSKGKPELDTSTRDSADTSDINDRHQSSMHLKLQRTHASKSCSQSKNQLESTEVLLKEAEAAATGSGSDTGSKVRVEKPVAQQHCEPPVRKEKQEEDLNREMEFKTSLGPSQERFDQDQGKVTLETTSITEQTTPKNQIKSLCAPFLNQKRISQGLESNIKSQGDDMPLGPERNWKESCEKICVKEEKIVKSKFRMEKTDIYGETCEKDNISDQPKEKLQKDDFENKSEEELSETSSATLTNISDSLEKKKEKSPYSVEDLQSIPGQLSNNMSSKKSTSQFKNDSKSKTECTSRVNEENVAYVAKNIIKVDSKIDINGIKEDKSFGTEMTYSQHRNISSVEPNSGNLFQPNCPGSHFGDQLIQSDNMKSIIQEEKPEVTSPRKCKKKTKHLETLDKNNYYNDYNSIYEQSDYNSIYDLSDEMDSLEYRDRISRMHLDKELRQETQRYTNESRLLQAEPLALEKEKIQPQKEVEEKRQEHQQKKMETLRGNDGDSMESHHHGKDEGNNIPGKEMSTFSEEYLVFVDILKRLTKKIFNKKDKDKVEMAEDAIDDLTQAHDTGSICLQRSEKIIVTSSLSVKHQKKTNLVKITRISESIQYTVREPQERRKTKSRSKDERDKEHYTSRLEGENQNGEKLQSELGILSYESPTIHQEHRTLKKKDQDYLFVKNRLDTLSNRFSKAKNELHQLRDALKVKTSLIEKTQRQIKQVKEKVRKYRLENHILKEKCNRAALQEELLQERISELQREILLPQPFEDAQKKGAFKKGVFKNIGMCFGDRSMTVDADVEKQARVAEEENEQIRRYEKELEEQDELIRKLQEKVAESRKENFILKQIALEMKQIWKKYQRESELYEYQEQNKREKQYIKDIEDILKTKYAISENSGEQTDKNEDICKRAHFYLQYIRYLEEQLEAESSKQIQLELQRRMREEQDIALQSLQHLDDNLE